MAKQYFPSIVLSHVFVIFVIKESTDSGEEEQIWTFPNPPSPEARTISEITKISNSLARANPNYFSCQNILARSFSLSLQIVLKYKRFAGHT